MTFWSASAYGHRRSPVLLAVLCLVSLFSIPLLAGEAVQKPTRAERRAEIETQLKRLQSDEWSEREAAMEALRKHGAAALPFLTAQDHAADADFAARLRQLVKLARIGAGQELGLEAGDLLEAYPAQPPNERAETAGRLVRLKGTGAVPVLLGLLDSEEDEEVQRAIIAQLSWLTTGMDGLKPLLKFYARCGEGLKGPVLQTLAAIRCDESRKVAREALADGAPGLKLWAIRAAQRLGDREALPAIRKLAEGGADVERDLRQQALDALTGLNDETAGPIFRKLLKEGEAEFRQAALRGIAGIKDRAAAPLLLEILHDPEKKDLHEDVVDAMGPLNDPSFVPELVKLLEDRAEDSAGLRLGAIHALAYMDARAAAKDIAACLHDSDLDVRKAAANTVAALGYREAAPELKKMLHVPDLALAHEAAKALANLNEPEGLKRLIDTARRLQEGVEAGGDVLRAAQDAINLLGEWQVKEALPVLEKLPRDGEEAPLVFDALFNFEKNDEAYRELLRGRVNNYLSRPNDPNAATYLAMLYAQRGLDEEAIAVLEKAVRHTPSNCFLLDRLASTYHEAGRYAECDAAYARLEALAGIDANYLNNRAWFFCTAFSKDYLRPQPSLDMAERAVSLEPRSTHIVDTLGWAQHGCGHFEDALKNLRRALELKDGADKPDRAWERTRIARTLWALGRKDDARAEIATALEDAPDHADVWFEAAGFYSAAGLRDEAVHGLHKSIEKGWVKLAAMKLNPEFDSIREDPGYVEALRSCENHRKAVLRLVEQVREEEARAVAKSPPTQATPKTEVMDLGDIFIVE